MAMQPLNQPIEMIDRERQTGAGSAWARRVAGLTGEDWQATFAFRAGYSPTKASASPRRRLGDVVEELVRLRLAAQHASRAAAAFLIEPARL